MPITVRCPCGEVMTVRDQFAGKVGRCPVCKQPLAVPAAAAAAPAPAPAGDRTADAVAELRKRWPGRAIDLLAVWLPAGADAGQALDELAEAVQSSPGANQDLLLVRGQTGGAAAGTPFIGLVGRHPQPDLPPWFCWHALEAGRGPDHHIALSLGRPADDLLRPQGGAAHVVITAYRWSQDDEEAEPAPRAPARPLIDRKALVKTSWGEGAQKADEEAAAWLAGLQAAAANGPPAEPVAAAPAAAEEAADDTEALDWLAGLKAAVAAPDAGAAEPAAAEPAPAVGWADFEVVDEPDVAEADAHLGIVAQALDVASFRAGPPPPSSAELELPPAPAAEAAAPAGLPQRSRVREAEALSRAEESEVFLRHLRASRTVADVLPALQSVSPEVRAAAAERLGELGGAAAVGPLVMSLGDAHPAVRRRAVAALGEVADPRALEPLAARQADRDEDAKVREEATWALARLPHPQAARRAAPVLVRWAADDSARAGAAAAALGAMKDPGVAELLVKHLPQDCAGPDAGTLRALRAIGAPHTVAPLLAALQDEDYLVRSLIAELLGETGDPRATPALAAAVRDPDKGLRKAAVEALGKIGDPAAVAALQQAAHDKAKSVRRAAADALEALGITFY